MFQLHYYILMIACNKIVSNALLDRPLSKSRWVFIILYSITAVQYHGITVHGVQTPIVKLQVKPSLKCTYYQNYKSSVFAL